jgi:hypothetical protein
VPYHIGAFEFCIVLNAFEFGGDEVAVRLDLATLLLVVNEVEAGDVVLDLDLAGEVHELRQEGGTFVSREGITSMRSSLIRSSRICREPKELRVVTRFCSCAVCGSLIIWIILL